MNRLERSLLYTEAVTQQFSENRAEGLRGIATIQRKLSEQFFEKGNRERGKHFLELAEQALNKALAIEDTVATRISLAELFMQAHSDSADLRTKSDRRPV